MVGIIYFTLFRKSFNNNFILIKLVFNLYD